MGALKLRGLRRIRRIGLPGAPSLGAGGGGGAAVLRGMGQATYMTIAGKGIGSTNRSQRLRSLHRAQARTDKISVVFGVFRSDSTVQPIVDTKFDVAMNWGAGFEPNPPLALTGLAPRTPFLFGGQALKAYDPATWDPNVWVFESDPLDVGALMGRFLEKNEIFGCSSAQEVADLNGNNMPYQRPLSSFINRFWGLNISNVATVTTGGYLSGTSFNALNASRTGTTGGIMPLYFKFSVPKTMISLWVAGDSITQDQKVGYGQNPALFDVMGDSEGNASFAGIAMKRLDIMGVSAGRGSDGDKNMQNANNWAGRLQAMVNANPTYIDLTTGANDYTSATNSGGWVASTAYNKFAIKAANSNYYMAITGGTSAASGGPAGTGKGIADGTVTWDYLGPVHGDNRDLAYTVFGQRAKTIDNIKAAFVAAGKVAPPVRIMTPLPKGGGTTDAYATPGNQTLSPANPIRVKLFDLYMDATLKVTLGQDDTFSLAPAIETAQNSGIIRTNGSANFVLDGSDSVHPLDQGHVDLAAIYPAVPAVGAAILASAVAQ